MKVWIIIISIKILTLLPADFQINHYANISRTAKEKKSVYKLQFLTKYERYFSFRLLYIYIMGLNWDPLYIYKKGENGIWKRKHKKYRKAKHRIIHQPGPKPVRFGPKLEGSWG